MSTSMPPATTTNSGIPAASDQHSLTVGPTGPAVLHDHYVVQKLQHFNRERVPERVVHAKGSGAHGFFEVTEDVTWLTRASFLARVGKRTPVFARFSTVAGEQGSADTVRDPRGFALKLYTDEGNYDLVGNNTPVFFVRDAASNMNGYGSHTFSTVNAGGERFWVKFHFKTAQGSETFRDAEAKALAAEDPDFHRRDLSESIAAGRAPEWRLELQVMPWADAAGYRLTRST